MEIPQYPYLGYCLFSCLGGSWVSYVHHVAVGDVVMVVMVVMVEMVEMVVDVSPEATAHRN